MTDNADNNYGYNNQYYTHNNPDGSLVMTDIAIPIYNHLIGISKMFPKMRTSYTISPTYVNIQSDLQHGSWRVWFSSRKRKNQPQNNDSNDADMNLMTPFNDDYNSNNMTLSGYNMNNLMNSTRLNRNNTSIRVVTEYLQYDDSDYVWSIDNDNDEAVYAIAGFYFNKSVIRNDDYIQDDITTINMRINDIIMLTDQVVLYDNILELFTDVNTGVVIPNKNDNDSVVFINAKTGRPSDKYNVMPINNYKQYQMIYTTYHNQVRNDYQPIMYYDM